MNLANVSLSFYTHRQSVRKSLLFITFILFHVFKIFHLFFSPVLVVLACSQGVMAGCFITFVLLFLSSVLLGRAFCGWICPGAGLQELCSLAITKKSRGVRWYKIKYAISSLWIGVMIYVLIRAQGFHRIDLLWGMDISTPMQNFMMLFGVVMIVVPTAWLFGKWAFCHYICWLAPLMIAGRIISDWMKWPSLRLQAERDRCVDCQLCDDRCPMSLDVSAMVKQGFMRNSECILCGNCANACPAHVIRYSFWKSN
ncbi:MAG: 4Fe-4S binding protein [Candidatus Omnitrophota bacterium]